MRNPRLEDFASKAMQGILSAARPTKLCRNARYFNELAEESVNAAKALIKKIDEDGAKG